MKNKVTDKSQIPVTLGYSSLNNNSKMPFQEKIFLVLETEFIVIAGIYV